MVVAGIPMPRDDHVEGIAEMALAMRAEAQRCAAETGLPIEVRIGVDTGPIVAGVIGRAKFIYDLWGDTVNGKGHMTTYLLVGRRLSGRSRSPPASTFRASGRRRRCNPCLLSAPKETLLEPEVQRMIAELHRYLLDPGLLE